MIPIALATLLTAAIAWTGPAHADPGKDESGKGRGRAGYERGDGPGDRHGDERPRRAVRAFKQEYDDGTCKVERKLEKSGEYKEEVKCRNRQPRPYAPAYGYRY